MTAHPINPHAPGSASISAYLEILPRFNLSIWTLHLCGCSTPVLSASSLFLEISVERRFVIPGLDHPTALQVVRELNRLAGWDDEIAAWQARRLATLNRPPAAGDTAVIGDPRHSEESGDCHEQ